MSDGEKRYPPSDLKLARLRDSGEIPKTNYLVSASVVLGGLLVIFLARGGALSVGDQLRHSLTVTENSETALSALTNTFQVLFSLLLRSVGLIAVLALLAGLIQNRFLFLAGLVRFDGARVFDLGRNLFGDLFSRTTQFFAGLLVGLLWIAAAVALGVATYQLIGSGSLFQQTTALNGATKMAIQMLSVAVFFAVFVGVLARVIVGLRFRAKHSMSREELEAEYRELEGSPELKGLRRDLYAEAGE